MRPSSPSTWRSVARGCRATASPLACKRLAAGRPPQGSGRGGRAAFPGLAGTPGPRPPGALRARGRLDGPVAAAVG
eukprot:7447604-Lingulodinium_polyedra.AAC.1